MAVPALQDGREGVDGGHGALRRLLGRFGGLYRPSGSLERFVEATLPEFWRSIRSGDRGQCAGHHCTASRDSQTRSSCRRTCHEHHDVRATRTVYSTSLGIGVRTKRKSHRDLGVQTARRGQVPFKTRRLFRAIDFKVFIPARLSPGNPQQVTEVSFWDAHHTTPRRRTALSLDSTRRSPRLASVQLPPEPAGTRRCRRSAPE